MKKVKYLSILSALLLALGVTTSAYANPDKGVDDPRDCPPWLCGGPDDDDDPVKQDK